MERSLSPFAEEMLRLSWDEGEHQLPEAWWHAGLQHPDARPSDQLRMAEDAIATLFDRGLIEFGWIEPNAEPVPMTVSDAAGVVQRRQAWTGDGRRVWFWTTAAGRAWLEEHPHGPVR